MGWVALGAITVGTVVYFAAGGPQAFAEGLTPAVESLSERATNGVQAMLAKKPDVAIADRLQKKYGLTDAERRRLHDALTGLGLTDAQYEEAFRDFAREKQQRKEEKEKLRQQNQEQSGEQE